MRDVILWLLDLPFATANLAAGIVREVVLAAFGLAMLVSAAWLVNRITRPAVTRLERSGLWIRTLGYRGFWDVAVPSAMVIGFIFMIGFVIWGYLTGQLPPSR